MKVITVRNNFEQTQMMISKRIWNWLKNKKAHIISWLLFITYEAIAIVLINGKSGPFYNYIIYYSLHIVVFYVHAHFVLRYSFRKQQEIFWKLPLFTLIEAICFLLIIYGTSLTVVKFTGFIPTRKIEFTSHYFIIPLYRLVYFLGFSSAYFFLLKFVKEKRKTVLLEKQRVENLVKIAKSESAFLRTQIQPHFLFNTLDFIYHNARHSSPLAAETILSLSEMMRYALDSNNGDDLVAVGKEIAQVENLINLHQLRQNHSLQIRLNYDDEVHPFKIIPFVLITMVENIFKHGDLTNWEKPAEININLIEDNLVFETINLIASISKTSGLK